MRTRRAAFIEALDRNDALFDRFAVRPLQLEQLQADLPDGALVVSPVVLDDRVVVFAVTADAITHFDRTLAANEVRRLVEDYLARTDPGRLVRGAAAPGAKARSDQEASRAELVRLGGRLYDLLLRPAFASLGVPETLVVSASGVLRYLPFSGLHDGERWVIERTTVLHMTALSQRRGGRAAPPRSLLAVADPDGTLPGTRVEVDTLAAAFATKRVLLGAEATASALRRAARRPGYDVLHLATHGRLDASNPERSHIVLAGKPLTYRDIPALKLRSTRLVVLSACETAVKAGGTGVEIAGLAYQFQRTRVDAVVATLWPVDDRRTADLMRHLYARLQAGDGYARALAGAQRALLAGDDETARHPAFWAPFVLLGSP